MVCHDLVGRGGLVAKLNVVDLQNDRIVLSHDYLSRTPARHGQRRFSVGRFQLALHPGRTLAPWWVIASTGDRGALRLALTPRQGYVLHGRGGIIQQGPGGPSAYYSAPRLVAHGTLTVAGKPTAVSGQGWLDHQWGNFGSDLGALRWNWFACQFRDGRDLMLYQFLDPEDRPTGQQTGTLVTATAATKHLARFTIVPLPPATRPPGALATYPLRWRLRAPGAGIDITLRARARNQFITNRFVPNFWEAASSITSGGPGTCTVESSRDLLPPS